MLLLTGWADAAEHGGRDRAQPRAPGRRSPELAAGTSRHVFRCRCVAHRERGHGHWGELAPVALEEPVSITVPSPGMQRRTGHEQVPTLARPKYPAAPVTRRHRARTRAASPRWPPRPAASSRSSWHTCRAPACLHHQPSRTATLAADVLAVMVQRRLRSDAAELQDTPTAFGPLTLASAAVLSGGCRYSIQRNSSLRSKLGRTEAAPQPRAIGPGTASAQSKTL